VTRFSRDPRGKNVYLSRQEQRAKRQLKEGLTGDWGGIGKVNKKKKTRTGGLKSLNQTREEKGRPPLRLLKRLRGQLRRWGDIAWALSDTTPICKKSVGKKKKKSSNRKSR